MISKEKFQKILKREEKRLNLYFSDSITFREKFNNIIKAIKKGKIKFYEQTPNSPNLSLIFVGLKNQYVNQKIILPVDEQFDFYIIYEDAKNKRVFFRSNFFKSLSRILAYKYLNSKEPLDQCSLQKFTSLVRATKIFLDCWKTNLTLLPL